MFRRRTLEEVGIYVRWFDEERLRNQLRISIGTEDENAQVLRVIAELLSRFRDVGPREYEPLTGRHSGDAAP